MMFAMYGRQTCNFLYSTMRSLTAQDMRLYKLQRRKYFQVQRCQVNGPISKHLGWRPASISFSEERPLRA